MTKKLNKNKIEIALKYKLILHRLALRSFCLDAKRTKKIKAHPNRSARWAGSAAVAPCVTCSLIYDSLVALNVPVQTSVAVIVCNACAAIVKYCRRCAPLSLHYDNKSLEVMRSKALDLSEYFFFE
jgi:hypothetical protein